jgi:glycerophosphoryl diester phosphodiesterase
VATGSARPLGERFRRASGGPLLWAHRGASAHAVENTMAAFSLAADARADGIELDVRTCASGEVVVFHDRTLERLAGRSGIVAELPWTELRNVPLRGERIPLLDDVLDLALGAGMAVNVELKGDVPSRVGLVRAVVRLLSRRSASALERVLCSSFRPEMLLGLRLTFGKVPGAFLFDLENTGARRSAALLAAFRPDGAHPHRSLVDAPHVATWHRRGMFVASWTADDPRELRRLDHAGVDGIITNDPAAARAALARPKGVDGHCPPGGSGL